VQDVRVARRHGVDVELVGEAVVGGQSDFELRFTDAATGAPLTGLKPYLGAAGHVAVLKSDGSGFAHQHAETEDARGRPVFAVPGTTFGPSLDLHTQFPTPGAYRIWAQFRLPDDTVITAPFTVHAPEPGHAERSTHTH
jgi:Cu+-exporting ATPase